MAYHNGVVKTLRVIKKELQQPILNHAIKVDTVGLSIR